MRPEVLKLKDIGKMPTESINDDETIMPIIEQYDELLSKVEKPITLAEAEILISIFPDGFFYDLHWDLIRLVESVIASDQEYEHLIKKCSSQEWKETLLVRYENWKNKG